MAWSSMMAWASSKGKNVKLSSGVQMILRVDILGIVFFQSEYFQNYKWRSY